MLEVLQTLKEIDESFADSLKELAQPKKRAKGSSDWRLSEHIEFIAPTVLLEQLVNTIQLESLDRLVPSWEKMFAELVDYKEIHGHCNVPQQHGTLGYWCSNLRQFRKKNKLSSEKIARLDAISFSWNTIDAVWDKMLTQLVAYKEIHGHCNVPQNSGPLGHWCTNQRHKKDRLSPGRIARLEAEGFSWDLDAAAWEQKFVELVAFKKTNGHCNVPRGHPLESWCGNLRFRKSKLSPDKIARLQAEGFCWNFEAAVWEQRFAELIAYKKVNGHCNVPQNCGPLGSWCCNMRHRKNGLSPERIARLEAEGFCWAPHSDRWENMFAELVAYKKANGHCNVPRGTLGYWCSNLRQFRKKGKLSAEKIAQLDALGFCWQFRSPKLNMAFPQVDLLNPAEGVECSDEVRAATTFLAAVVGSKIPLGVE